MQTEGQKAVYNANLFAKFGRRSIIKNLFAGVFSLTQKYRCS